MNRLGFFHSYLTRFHTALACAVVVACSTASLAQAQQLPSSYLKNGPKFRAAFRPVVNSVTHSVVRVFANGEPAALGVIVRSDGYLLSKASQLQGTLSVMLDDGREIPGRLVAADVASDLALVQVQETDLVAVEWEERETPVGSWVVSAGNTTMPVGVGVVSVGEREIAPQRGVLGVVLDDVGIGATISRVFPGSAAARAGLEVGDIITNVSGQLILTRENLINHLSQYRPGETLPLIVKRGEKQEQVMATLGNEWSASADRQARQNMMGGALSIRSGGFMEALQHDTVLRPEDCGGPVLNLQGKVVGLNIARAGRVESYALPVASVKRTLGSLFMKIDVPPPLPLASQVTTAAATTRPAETISDLAAASTTSH